MSYERSAIARQGTHDGLCGLYCLVNALRHEEEFRQGGDSELLRYLLEAAAALNNLSAGKIAGGYEAHELVAIFNQMARSFDLGWSACLLSTAHRKYPKLSPLVLAKRIFEEGGQMVLHTKDYDHWFLAYSFDFEKRVYLVEDSDDREDEKKTLDPKRVMKLGAILLPPNSALMANR